ncbi:MAG: hypothetical protein FWG46_01295 [Treponema sp.]|nr:hypothetical protein [Treponema sp.]
MALHGTVIRLVRYAAKGSGGEAADQALLIEGHGMEGDFHADGGLRQISLLTEEERKQIDSSDVQGLCFGRYRENILLGGIPPAALVPGTRLKAGEAVLEIGDARKRCFEECPLFSGGQGCFLAGRSLFARVLRGGNIHIGDHIEEEW